MYLMNFSMFVTDSEPQEKKKSKEKNEPVMVTA